MKWLSTTADEQVLVDESGRNTGYKIRRDPLTSVYYPHPPFKLDYATRLKLGRLAIVPVKRWCEERYDEQLKKASRGAA